MASEGLNQSLFGPMVDVLRAAFGVEFGLADTGGGCTALIGEFEGGVAVYLTDAPTALYGKECQITPFHEGIRAAAGVAVGVYVDEHATQLAYGEYPQATHHQLPVLVAEQLAVAANNRVHDNNSSEHIFPEVHRYWRGPHRPNLDTTTRESET